MKAPNFWHKKNLTSYLLLPLSWLFGLGILLRYLFTQPKAIKKPIICVGNLVAGGAGKTPIAIEIGQILKEMKINFAYLSYGYGRDLDDFIKVESKNNVSEVGDEPILLSEISDTFVASDRIVGAQKIDQMPEKQLIILDDGFQNAALFKNFHILVIDGFYGFGNKMLIPSGPLREPIMIGAKRADLVIIVGLDKTGVSKYFSNKKIIHADIKILNAAEFTNKNIVAFCGIGRPSKFFHSLKETGANLIKKINYADHYVYKNNDLEYLISLAKKENAILVTTKKDWVRISSKYQKEIKYLDIKIEFENKDLIKESLRQLL